MEEDKTKPRFKRVKIEEIRFLRELYPRFDLDKESVNQYTLNLDALRARDFELSEININVGFKDRDHVELLKKQIQAGYELPIEVYEENGVYKIIDGGHAWQAYKELGKEPADVKVLTFKDNAEKIAYSRHKNINRLQQTPVTYTRSLFEELKLRLGVKTDEEVKRILRRLYNIKRQPDRYNETEYDKRNVSFIENIFRNEPNPNWETFVRVNLEYLDFPLWLAEMVDRGELSAAQAAILNGKEVVEKLDEETRKRIATLLKGKSVKETKKGIDELVKFEPQVFNVWNFPDCNPLFGIENALGRIPGQIVQNVLHYWTEEGDLVVDPMAGGGTTIDVCNLMKRRCLAYDINPLREDIIKWDIRRGFPKEAKNCDLIFLDPPYFNMVFDIFRSLDEFHLFIQQLAKDSYETVRNEGFVALLIMNQTEKFEAETEYPVCIPHVFDCYEIFRKAGFKLIQAVSTPLTTQQFLHYDVERAKQRKWLLGTYRDLLIFQKEVKS